MTPAGTTRTRGGRRTTTAAHGTEGEYRRGCRCDLCRQASTAARAARNERHVREREIESAQAELEQLQKMTTEPGAVATVERDTFDEYVHARQEHDEAWRRLLLAELELKRAVGPAEIIRVVTPGGRVHRVGTWAVHPRRFLDQAALKAKHPAIAERFMKVSQSRRFVISMFAATPPQRKARATAKGVRR